MRRRLAGERGSGMLSTAFGIGVFLSLMLLAAQVLTYLYASTVLEATTYDVAVHAAGTAGDITSAEAVGRASLGSLGGHAVFDWSASTDEEVVVRVAVSRAHLVGTRLAERLGLATIEREARVRVERLR